MRSVHTLTLSGNWIDLPSLRALLDKFPTLEILDLDHTGIVNVPNGLFEVNNSWSCFFFLDVMQGVPKTDIFLTC